MRIHHLVIALGTAVVIGGASAAIPLTESLPVQKRDTIVRLATAPQHKTVGRLVEDLTIGDKQTGEEYEFSQIMQLIPSAAGGVWVIDGYVKSTLRLYDEKGKFVRVVGRRGNGPGEYQGLDASAVLPDGRVVVREFERSKIHVYRPNGDHDTDWVFESFYWWLENEEMTADSSGVLWIPFKAVRARGSRENPNPEGAFAYLRVRPSGKIVDTVFAPTLPVTSEPGRATMQGQTRSYNASYLPRPMVDVSPLGYFVTAVSSRYAIDMRMPANGRAWKEGDPVMSLRASAPAIIMSSAERAWRKSNFERSLSGPRPTTVSVPDVPATKMPIKGFNFDPSGRIWVSIASPATEVASPPKVRDAGGPKTSWSEPQLYDIFEPNGTYVGRVNVPAWIRAIRGDTVWTIGRNADDVESVKRYHIVW